MFNFTNKLIVYFKNGLHIVVVKRNDYSRRDNSYIIYFGNNRYEIASNYNELKTMLTQLIDNNDGVKKLVNDPPPRNKYDSPAKRFIR